ncbi:MAG TPA: 1,6-anhydro-N-acetylmuramyl-L-alanine amidase AmpD [Acidiferrobacteraceae bacterium]|nr:1,6-anhydro-N-acetylmuramyl-L-alanine amidase AmpD [Acidiferrobacteraceae bacterium]
MPKENFTIDVKTGLVEAVRFVKSPNADDRPQGVEVDLLVIHAISLPPGEFGGEDIEALFCNRLDPNAHPYYAGIYQLRVSAHFLIRRDGELLQFVPVQRRAWHAGESSFQGRNRVNDFSIGVELEGSDDTAFADAQYDNLLILTRALMMRFPVLGPGRITGHADVAPGRKTDPGPYFQWQRFRDGLA